MRWAIVIACLIGLVASSSVAAPPKTKAKPKTLSDKIQGKWARKNHAFSFVIEGNVWTEFSENKVGAANAKGTIEFPPGKEYAIVTTNNNAILWLWSAGEGVLAVETFSKDGVIWEDGRIFYQPDFAP